MNPNQEELIRQIETKLDTHGAGIEGSVWIGGATEEPWFQYHSEVVRPAASSIKTFYLVELFAKYRNQLDSPLPGTAAILDDETHPAISHFSPAERREIRQELGGASVRRLGKLMMGSESTSNHVYNAAANVTTAILGGPAELTRAIHRRDAAFGDVQVNRYMLRDRTQPGDNVLSSQTLASLYRNIATSKLPEIDEPTREAIMDAIKRRRSRSLGTGYVKEGSLASNPLTRVDAGWWDSPHGPLIYVVMLEQPTPGGDQRQAASEKLQKLCREIRNLAVEARVKAWSAGKVGSQ